MTAAAYAALPTSVLQERLAAAQQMRQQLAGEGRATSGDYAAASSHVQTIAAVLRERGITPDLWPT